MYVGPTQQQKNEQKATIGPDHGKQNQQNIAAASVGWHDDAPEEPKMMKNGSDHIEDDQLTNRLNFKTTFLFQGLMARDAETPMACMN